MNTLKKSIVGLAALATASVSFGNAMIVSYQGQGAKTVTVIGYNSVVGSTEVYGGGIAYIDGVYSIGANDYFLNGPTGYYTLYVDAPGPADFALASVQW